jgi:hypothetical protein
MSFYRQRWRVELDGVDEPIEVTTSARDSQDVVVAAGPGGTPAMPLGVPLKIVHNALLRTEAAPPDVIPRNFQKFLDLVLDADEIPDDDGEGAGELDPTQTDQLGN